MKRPIIISLLLALFCIQIHSVSQYYFKQISLKDGLSQSMVNCVISDYKGVIWIGTHFGLNSFDREHLTSYYYEKETPLSLPDNDIIFLAEDARFDLWIGTEKGLALYNRNTNNFTRITFDNLPLKVYCSLLIEDGILFFGTGSVFKYTYATAKITSISVSSPEKPTSAITRAFIYDNTKQTALLSCRWDGVWLYHIPERRMERLPFIEAKEITSVCLSSSGHIWISVYAEGVYGYDRTGQLLKHLSAPGVLKNNVVLDIKEKDGELWMATDGGGITLYNFEKHSVRTIEHVPGDVHSLPVNSFWCLYSDEEDNMWAGSIRGGLIGMKEIYMNTFQDAPLGSACGLSNKTVTGMYEDADRTIWLGTDGGGLNRFDPHAGTFRHYPSTYNAKVVSIVNYNKDELLMSLFSRGLYLFNKQTGRMSEYRIADEDKYRNMFRTGRSVHLHRVDQECFYLLSDSVYLYNQTKKLLTTVVCKETDVTLSSLQPVFGNKSVSYFRSVSDLLELDHHRDTMRVISSFRNSIGSISAACRDEQGCFWLGTSTGLYRFDTAHNKVDTVETDRFIGTTSLGFDLSGRLWVGTHNGLYAFLPDDRRIVVFGESDGVYANEYISKSPLVTLSGDIYMAGITGLVYIKNDLPFKEDPDPSIHLLDVVLNGVSVGQDVAINGNKLSIPWSYTSLSAKVIVKENDLMRKKLFRFYIKGKQEEKVESPNHTIAFHALSVGAYHIYVSCSKKNGEWSIPVEVLSVTVTPPWWKTIWFFALVFCLLLGGAALFARLLVRNKERKMIWAIKEHERQTYEDKVRFLINISHELRTPLTLVYTPLKRLLTSGEVKDEPLLRQLNGIFRQTRRIRDIINMVLDIRKMEVGSETLHIRNQNMNSWLQEVGEDFSPEFRARNIRLVYELDTAVGEVSFDAPKCEIVLSNLLINALKFSEPDTCITLSSRLMPEGVRISVSDQGIGLYNVDLSRLFTRFYQGDHDRKGSGIGLSYSRLLIEMQGGRIGGLNNTDRGATFYFELPLENKTVQIEMRPYINELLVPLEDKYPDAVEFPIRKYSLLVVEDEPELRKYLKETLSNYFRQVYVAEDGVQALEAITRNQPDLIVSDVMMPRMNGFELCRQVKSNIQISHIPVLLLTARTDSDSAVLGYKLGADIYLPKPFDLDLLLSVLRNLLRSREAVRLRYKDAALPVSPKEDTISNADEQFMQKLNKLITDNMMNPDLDVNFIAEQMAMSRASLYTKLKQLIDISTGDYINKLRMAKAIQLLADKNIPIQEVSDQCGFSHQRYFSTVFKQAYGTTPSRYRQEQKQTPD